MGPPLIGSKSAIKDAYGKNRFSLFQTNIFWLILGLLNLLFATVGILFWRMQPDQPIYFWFAIANMVEAMWGIPNFASNCSDLPGLLTLPGDASATIEFTAWILLFQNAPLWPGRRKVWVVAFVWALYVMSSVASYSGRMNWSNYYVLAAILFT